MLKGLKVVEFEGLAPTVFCGMYFADQGAEVILVARGQPAPFSMPIDQNIMNRGKKCVVLNLKNSEDMKVIHQLIKSAQVVIDPYRPGVLENLSLGPPDLQKINPAVVLLRVSGYGQKGPMALRPGHDLNYVALSGALPLINGTDLKLQFPTNYLADFVSCSLGINACLAAVIEGI